MKFSNWDVSFLYYMILIETLQGEFEIHQFEFLVPVKTSCSWHPQLLVAGRNAACYFPWAGSNCPEK